MSLTFRIKGDAKPDSRWKRILKSVKDAGKHHARVGYFDTEEGAEDRGGLTNAQLGAIHEFGTDTIPERSHLRTTFVKNKSALKKLLQKISKNISKGLIDGTRAMELLGVWGEAEVKKFVTTGPQIPPPNAPATKKRKEDLGSSAKGGVRTLVDTGRMIGSITHKVESGS